MTSSFPADKEVNSIISNENNIYTEYKFSVGNLMLYVDDLVHVPQVYSQVLLPSFPYSIYLILLGTFSDLKSQNS